MTKEKLMQIAERNLKKAILALHSQINRPGITEKEIQNLTDNVEFAEIVRELIESN